MIRFLESNWIWILLIGGMLLMHVGHRHGGHAGQGTGGGCGGGHTGHGGGQDHHGGTEDSQQPSAAESARQHGGHPDPGLAPADEAPAGNRPGRTAARGHGGC